MRLFKTAFLGQAGEPCLQDRALWQRASVWHLHSWIWDLPAPHNPQILSVAGGDFVGWGNPLPTRQIIPWAKTPGGDELCICGCWWHIFLLKQIWGETAGQKSGWSYLLGNHCFFIAQGWGPGRSGEWPELTLDRFLCHKANGDSSLQRRHCREYIAVLKYFEESTTSVWWILVKKRHKGKPRKVWKQFHR